MNQHREVWKNFIVIEGIDGAGTTTLSRLLSESLNRASRSCLSGCEPTNGPIGRLIRSALSGTTPVTPSTLALLFAADRREHLYGPGGIKEILDSGARYLSDRYFFSSLAYQSIDSDWNWVNHLNGSYPLPEFLVFLGLPVTDALGRIAGRSGREIFEFEDIQHKVAANYKRALDLFRSTGMKILELDGTRLPEELNQTAMAFILGDSS